MVFSRDLCGHWTSSLPRLFAVDPCPRCRKVVHAGPDRLSRRGRTLPDISPARWVGAASCQAMAGETGTARYDAGRHCCLLCQRHADFVRVVLRMAFVSGWLDRRRAHGACRPDQPPTRPELQTRTCGRPGIHRSRVRDNCFGGTLVPALVSFGPAMTWCVLGLLSLIATACAWNWWPTETFLPAAPSAATSTSRCAMFRHPQLVTIYGVLRAGGCRPRAAYGLLGRLHSARFFARPEMLRLVLDRVRHRRAPWPRDRRAGGRQHRLCKRASLRARVSSHSASCALPIFITTTAALMVELVGAGARTAPLARRLLRAHTRNHHRSTRSKDCLDRRDDRICPWAGVGRICFFVRL